MFALTKLETYGVVLLVLGLAIGGAYLKGHRDGKDAVQEKFDTYTAKVEADGKLAEANKILKETQSAKQISDAVTARDDVLKRMQSVQAAANSRFRTVPSNPTAPTGSRQVCFDSSAYNAAFQSFGAGVTQFLQATSGQSYEGDVALLNAKTLIQAWPK